MFYAQVPNLVLSAVVAFNMKTEYKFYTVEQAICLCFIQ